MPFIRSYRREAASPHRTCTEFSSVPFRHSALGLARVAALPLVPFPMGERGEADLLVSSPYIDTLHRAPPPICAMNSLAGYGSDSGSDTAEGSTSRTSAAASTSKHPSTAAKRGRSSPSDDEAAEIDASDAFGLNGITRSEAAAGTSSQTYPEPTKAAESVQSGQAGNGTVAIRTAPEVIFDDPMAQRALLTRPTDTTMHVNIPYSDLSLPVVGPSNPYSHRKLGALQNSVNGHFEGTSMSDFDFRNQQRTFDNLGYAKDPSMYSDGSQVAGGYVGDVARARQLDGASALELRGGLHTDRQAAKERKKQRVGQEGDTSVVEGEGAYVGPWGGWSGEKVHVTEGVGPTQEEIQRAEELSTVRKKEKKEMEERRAREDEQGTEKSIFHGESYESAK